MFGEEVVISDVGIDVPSDNYEEFDQEIDPALLGEKLQQQNKLKGSRRVFQFYRGHYLLLDIQASKKSARRQFHLNLAWLAAEPEHIRHMSWPWLFAAITAALIAAVFFYLDHAGIITAIYAMIAAVLHLSAALIFSLIFIYQMRDEYVFYSHYSHTPLFLLENRRPTQHAFDNFFILLQQGIEKSQSNINVSQRLVGELKMCRRLKDEGVLSEEDYTRARGIIFKHKQYKA